MANVRRPCPGLSKLLCAALAAGLATAAGAQTLEWSRRAPMPVPTARGGSGVVDRTLVALGGTVANPDGTSTPTSLVQAYDADLDAWRYLAPLPAPRFAFASAAYGGSVYVAGGYAGSPFSLSSNVLAYDVDGGGAVRPVGELLTPRFRTSAAVLNGKLYVVGGGASGTTLASVEQVDLATGAAVELPPLPAPRQLAGVAAFAGSLFVMGGHDATGAPTDTCWELRPAWGQWLSCAPLPFARAGGGAEVAHGRILLPVSSIGGSPTAWSDQVLEYDPRTDVWTVRGMLATVRHGPSGVIQDHLLVAGADGATGAAVTEAAPLDVPPWPVLPLSLRARMPTPRGGGVAAVIDGRIVAVGGSNRNDPPPVGALATVEAFDVAGNFWIPLPSIHEARFSAPGAAVGHTVYLTAGASPTGLRADVLAYDAWSGTSWIDGPLLQPRFRHDAAVIGSRIYLAGGRDGGVLASVEAYDLEAHASAPVAPLPAPRDLPAAVAVDGMLYVLGGLDEAGAPATDVWAYDPATDAWAARSPLPIAPGGAPATVVGGRIVVLGGSLGGGPSPGEVIDAVQVYDPLADAWTVLGALDTFRWMSMVAAVGGEVFLIGGNDDSQALGLVESLPVHGGNPPTSTIEWPLDGAALNLHDVVVSGTAWDDGGLARVEISVDGGATWAVASGTTQWTYLWQPLWEGDHVLLGRAVDASGYSEREPYLVRVLVDWTAPSMAMGTDPRDGGTGFWNAPVSVAFTCEDALSGVASCPAPVLLSSEGANQIVSGTAWDRAGNGASAQLRVSVDLTPPAIAASPSAPASPAGWWNAPVTVAFACADALSGVASCSGPVTVSTEGAGQEAAGAAADVAGNSASTSLSVNIDWTPPDVVAQPTTPPNAAGWWNAPVTVAFTCSDALSGVSSCPDPATLPFECVGCGVGGYAVDRADNGAYAEAYVSVDMTPPQCAVAASGSIGPDGTYRSSAVVTVDASDALSGVAAVEVDAGAGFVPYDGAFVLGEPGTAVVTCRALDAAGNEGWGTPLTITIAPAGGLVFTDRAPMPVPTTRPAAGVVDRTLYVLGGVDATARPTANVWAYDADANAWRATPPLPEPRANAAVATLGATVYLAGGAGSGMAASTVVAYDVDTGTSRRLGTLLTPRYRAGGAINAGKLYVAGGGAAYAGTVLDGVEEIDLVTGASVAKLTLPAPRQSAGVATHGGWLYVMGGLDGAGQPTDTCWKIRVAYPYAWTACAALPYPRAGEALHGHGRILLAHNNVSATLPPTAWTKDVLAYDPSADVWSVLGQRSGRVHGSATGVIQDALFAAGGTDETGTIGATASAPLDVPEWPLLPWQLRRHMPAPRAGATPAVVDGRVVLLGGSNRNDPPPTGAVATVEAYDPASDAWTVLPPLPEPRFQSHGGAVDGVAYLAGGMTPGKPVLSDVLAYDVRTGTSWIDGSLLEPRFRHGAAVLDGRLYVAGGRGTSALTTSVEAYDPATHTSTPLAPLPGTRDLAKVVAAAGRLFVLGGYETTPEPTMLEYDFATGAWVNHPPPPVGTGGAPAIAVGRNIVVLAGGVAGPAPSEASDVVELYEPSTRTWTILGALDTFRSRASAAFLGGQLYLMGGDDGALPLSLVEAFTIDGTPPTSAILSPADGAFTNARQLLVTGTAWDDFGLRGVDVSDDGGATWSRASGRSTWSWAWMPLAEGEYALRSRATDSSGYLQDPPASARVTVDWTPPEVVATAAPPANASGWWNAPVTVSFACADALSGVERCPAPVGVSAETPAAGVQVAGTAADRAGNSASASLAVKLDLGAPTCAVSAAGTLGLNGIYVSDVVVTVAAADALSGVAAVEVSTGGGWTAYAGPVTVSSEGPTTVSCRATDAAGNVGTGALSFTIDRIAPAVASTYPSSGAVGVPLTVAITVTFAEPVLAGPAWSQLAVLNGKKVVPVTASISGSVVTLRPTLPLDRGRSHTVSVPRAAVTDVAGNAFPASADGSPYRFGFTTAK